MPIQVKQIDHVELTVPDRFEAAQWYEKILGLQVIDRCKGWADDPQGPLMIGTKEADTKLALFEGAPKGSKRNVGFHLVAFRVDGQEFLDLLDELSELSLTNTNGIVLSRNSVVDHELAFSIYFSDPWGNELEITTYAHEMVRQFLSNAQG